MPTINVKPGSDQQLLEIAVAIDKARKVVVVTGAGISTNLGIPDFRSENGLYSLISEQFKKQNTKLQKSANAAAADQQGPRKRRKLNRTQSMGPPNTRDSTSSELRISKRSLRSSKSMGIEELLSPEDEEPQPSTVGPRYSTPSVPTFLPQVPQNILSNVKGKDLFDCVIWKDAKSTQTHYTFITSLKHKIDEVQDTSEVHKFIRVLRDGGKLLRNYTQNIDMLEKREGLCTDLSRGAGSKARFNPKLRKVPREGEDHEGGKFDNGVEVVQLHGNLEFLRCGLCLGLCDWEEDDRHLTMLSGEAPPCPHCLKKTETRQENGRRGLSVGKLRPDIVLYGETNPHEQAIGDLSTHDIKIGPDMLIILGTSLKVHGLKLLLREFAKAVHTRGGKVIFVNNTKPPDSVWGDVIDYWVEWDCDAWVRDVKAKREDIWMPQGPSRESTPKPVHRQLQRLLPVSKPKPQIPQKKLKAAVPKNPQSMRIDYFCGAFMIDKILRTLRKKSGRGEDTERKARIERTNIIYIRAGKAAEKAALPAKHAAHEAKRERRRQKVAARKAEEEAASKKVADQELFHRRLSELPGMADPKIVELRRILNGAIWTPLLLNYPEQVRQFMDGLNWTPPSLQHSAHLQSAAQNNDRTWKPPSLMQQALLHLQAETLAGVTVVGQTNLEPTSMVFCDDKNSMAHLTWAILGNVSKKVGRERTLPETYAGQRTLRAENRRFGHRINELAATTFASAYTSSNYSRDVSTLGSRSNTPSRPASDSRHEAPSTRGSALSIDNARSIHDPTPSSYLNNFPPPEIGAFAQAPIRDRNIVPATAPTPSAKEKRVRPSRAKPKSNAAPPNGSQMFVPFVPPYSVGALDTPQSICPAIQPNAMEMDVPFLPPSLMGGALNTPQSFAPVTHHNGAHYVPLYDINRAALFGMSPTPAYIPRGKNPTPAYTPLMTPATEVVANAPKNGILTYADARIDRRMKQYKAQLCQRWDRYDIMEDVNFSGQGKGMDYSRALLNEVRLPTPPSSDDTSQHGGDQPSLPALDAQPPMTPQTQRIKTLGSIGAILSSPPPAPPTLSRESEQLMVDEIPKSHKRKREQPMTNGYPKPHAKEQMELWEGYPDLGKRAEPAPEMMENRSRWCNFL